MPNKLTFSEYGIEIACDKSASESVQEKLVGIYPVHYNRSRTQFKVSTYYIPEILKSFRGVTLDNISTAPLAVQKLFHKVRQSINQTHSILDHGPFYNAVVTPTLTLKPHQQKGREIAAVRDRYAFFYDTRTGKTPLSLSIIHDDIKQHPDHKWLVVCPLILIENAWMEDAEQFVPHLRVVNCHATTPKKRAEALAQDGDIYITNVESFAKYKDAFLAKGFHGCIVDESSTMKAPNSKTSQALVEFAYTVKRFYLLSGTPAPNGEWEYYQQLRAIDYYAVPQSYTQFKQHYFVNISYNPQYEKLVLRADRKEELHSLIKRYACYMDKEDVLTTPGRTFHEVELTMPDELKSAYNYMKNKLYVELGDDEVLIAAKSAAAKLNKLNQISSGFIMDTQAIKENKFYGDDKREWYLLSNYRFEKLLELLDADACRGEQVLIWANYRAEFEVIQQALKDRCRCVYGGTTIAEKTENIKAFKEGRVQYLVCNPASADKGLTLTNAHICIYFSLNWSYELFKQSMERIYADISKQPLHCHYYILMAKGTIDEVLYRDVLQGKQEASYAVLNHIKGGGI